MRLRTLHLFAGVGGGVLADLILGHQPVCAVEIDTYCQRVLHARQKDGSLPWFPIFDDVKTFDGKPWRGLVDVVCGGFPCQDISIAGDGAGIFGSRSGLWKHQARIIGEIRPRRAYMENTPALAFRGLGTVLGDLAELGYHARWGVLGVGDAGGLHQRNRMWIVASSDPWQEREQKQQPKKVFRQPIFSWCKNIRSLEDMRNRPDLFPSIVVRSYHGIPNAVDRVAAIGNAQCPIVAATAWRLLS